MVGVDGVVIGEHLFIGGINNTGKIVLQRMEIDRSAYLRTACRQINGIYLHFLIQVARGGGDDRGDLLSPVSGVGRTEVEMHEILMNEWEPSAEIQ